ncbi:hypothetical protein [Burkholderia multivorans]|uniref:hypothetical protein n=1 Tax=Burkholderia multivorans TaxID=87883 RepID=UPI00158908C7|nr:hypothetical protein [Burkholderia multivorans]MDR8877458.1 hypothetical protein [Burkholderia multivorans]MDR8883922.1 hypothetical protein [Burkholderia multivorans]MDR8890329.1 hypothetical protein [Burkholderia multivorans]MDR8909109.1 hypothetical protein [Burkholderia multivorans]MDR8914662.1 hypothetical protein [Burkholderia multivorans]
MENHATSKQLALARRHAASSIEWPAKTPFLLNPDPSVRKKLKQMAIIVGVLAVTWAVGNDPSGPLREWIQSIENREMKATMETAMKTGNRAAGTWLATHFWKDYPGLLQTEADNGEPTAMFVMGRILMQDSHPERFLMVDRSMTAEQMHAKGLGLVRRAAAAGNQDALLFAIRHGGL